jgi:hypothetical protein
MITTDRDEPVGFHTTFENKEALRQEAERRGKSMSLLIHEWLDERLKTAVEEEVARVRSSKRNSNEIDVPLPFPGD